MADSNNKGQLESSPASVRQLSPDVCLTCLGAGEISSERGPARCPDCEGTGQVGDHYLRTEKQLREVEGRSERLSGDVAQDVSWLIDELRLTRQALIQVLSAAQESQEGDDLLARIRFLANAALGVYKVRAVESED